MEGGNAVVGEILFAVLGNVFEQGALESHDFRSLNPCAFHMNSVFLHAPTPVDDLSGAYEHLLRVTPA
jgi:hypothetical protein